MKLNIKKSHKKQLSENKNKLIKEFNRAEQQAVMDMGDLFTVSYEVELESAEGVGGGFDQNSYENQREQLARDYLSDDYFYELVSEGDSENFWQSIEVDETDIDEIVEWYSLSETDDYNDNYKNFLLIKTALERNPDEAKELTSLISDVVEPGTELNRIFHKFMEEQCANLAPVQLEIFESMAKTLFKKHIINIDKSGALLYPEEPCSIDFLFQALGEEDLFTELCGLGESEWTDITSPAGWASVADMNNISTSLYQGSTSLEEFAMLVEKSAQEYIDKESERQYDEYREDPVTYLDDLGYEWDDSLDEEDFYGISDPESLLWEHLPNFMKKWSSSLKYEEDGSLDNGIEFSMDTPLYITGLDNAFEFLEDFYEDFNNQDNFEMNQNTGLHTNVGMLNEEGDINSDYNLVKGMLFLNQSFATKGMGMSSREFSRWVGDIRKKSKDLIASSISSKSEEGSIDFPSLEPQELINSLERDLSAAILGAARGNPKGMGFNINYINTRGYIEFRYPGDEEATLENMKKATLYYAHIVKTALSPNYKRRDYIKKLIGFVNKVASEESQRITSLPETRTLRPGAVLAQDHYGREGVDLFSLYRYLATKDSREEVKINNYAFRNVIYYFFNGIDAKEKVAKLSKFSPDGEVLSIRLPLEQLERSIQNKTYRVLSRSKKEARREEKILQAIHDFLEIQSIDGTEVREYVKKEGELQYSDLWKQIMAARKKEHRYRQTKDTPFAGEEPTPEEYKLAKQPFPEAETTGLQEKLRKAFKPFLDAAVPKRPKRKKKEEL